jgi:hypothetical protein
MTEMKKLTIHRALTELKNLDNRIDRAVNDTVIIIPNRKANDKIGGVALDDYKKAMQGTYDKVTDLIAYRNRLKAAVVQSNAETEVTVAGEKMTRAKAIERKDSISYEKNLLDKLRHQQRVAINKVAQENDSLPAKLETYIVNILGSKEKQTKEEVDMHTNTFMKRNEYELVDPIGAAEIIKKLEERIDEFEAEVDAVLSESNATSFIEIQA